MDTSVTPRHVWIFPAILIIPYLLVVSWSSRQLSPGVDEPLHLRSGMAQLTHGAYVDAEKSWWSKPDPLHPPIDMLPALVARMAGASPDFRDSPWIAPKTLIAARWVNHLLGAALLLVVFLFARDLWGDVGGSMAVLLLGLNPLFLAHASIISSDLTAAFGGTLAAFALWRAFLRDERWLNVKLRCFWLAAGFAGAAIGLSILCKVSNLVFVALGCIVVLSAGFRARKNRRNWLPLSVATALATSLMAILLSAAVFRFAGVYRDPIVIGEKQVQLGFFNDLVYCAHYALGLGEKLPTPVYYKGWFQEPSPKHYLAAFLYKTPSGLLILLAAGALIALSRVKQNRHPAAVFLFALIAFMSLYFTTRGFYLGVRHLLLPIALFTILAAAVAPHALKGKRRVELNAMIFVPILLLWNAIHLAKLDGFWVSSTNELARKRMVFVDSDFDWGQGLIALAEWQKKNSPDQPIWFSYFGSVRPEDYGVKYRGLLSPFSPGVTLDPEWQRGNDPAQIDGWVAFSATQLAGVFMGHVGQQPNYYEKWMQLPPAAKIAGGSIWIYDARKSN